MNRLILLGGGGHSLSVIDTVRQANYYDEIVILDVPEKVGETITGFPIIGTDDILPELYEKGYRDIFITVGSLKSTATRRCLAKRAGILGFRFINIIDPSACVSETVKMGKGIFVGKRAVINADSVIDDMAIINSGAIVEHGNQIGAYSHIAVGSILCGDVTVGSDCLIGANATVLQGVTIGGNSIIGAGSLVFRDVPSGSKLYG